MKTPELESRYITMATELANIKNGRYGHNIWFWAIQLYMNLSLRIRLIRLQNDYNENIITKHQYLYYSQIIKSAL